MARTEAFLAKPAEPLRAGRCNYNGVGELAERCKGLHPFLLLLPALVEPGRELCFRERSNLCDRASAQARRQSQKQSHRLAMMMLRNVRGNDGQGQLERGN
jgi:hypothetical protein